jgi:hypothetical protein
MRTICQGDCPTLSLPKTNVFPVRKVPKWKLVHGQATVQSSERVAQIPIILSSRFLIEGVEGPSTQQCTFVLLCSHAHACAPFPHSARPHFAVFHSHVHICGIPACLSAAPGHAFLQVSAAPLRLAFTCTSAAGSGSSAERTIGAEIVPHFLAHSILGLPHARGFPTPSQLVKKKWNNYLAFFMFVLLT